MNKPIVGRIYHVVDKTTGDIIKVGSTVQTVLARSQNHYYKKKYPNYLLVEVRTLESSEFDYYDSDDPFCPFLWHLVAAEHCEMLMQGTFRKGPLSNKQSPLDQKYFGFDGCVTGKLGGQSAVESGQLEKARNYPGRKERWAEILQSSKVKEARKRNGLKQGRKNVESGHWASLRTPEIIMMGAKAGGAVAAKTGQINRIKTPESCYRGGKTQGKRAVESGQWEEVKSLGLHTRWHIKESRCGRKPKPNPRCVFCSEQSLTVAYA